MSGWWLFDTDMLLHSLSPDTAVIAAVEELRMQNAPVAVSAFSKVEFKGNYIQDLILLRRKISDSDSLPNCAARILSAAGPSGRRVSRMFAQLIQLMDSADQAPGNWLRLSRKLVVLIDGIIPMYWDTVASNMGDVVDDFDCDRAREAPLFVRGKWNATIPNCRSENTTCSVVAFFDKQTNPLTNLEKLLEALGDRKTAELERIHKVVKETLTSGEYPWKGRTCRQVGDLLIGLQSKIGKGLVSSNKAEHNTLGGGLGYKFIEFPIASVRSK